MLEPSTVTPSLHSEPSDAVPLPVVEILGVAVHRVDTQTMLALIKQWMGAPGRCRQICTVNPEFIVDAGRDETFGAVLAQADLCVPDGVGVLLAARLLGQPVRERVTGSDGIYHVCEWAAQNGRTVFLLGAGRGVAEAAADRLKERYPALQVAGTYGGDPSDKAWPEILQRLQAATPDILFVAYGHPRQDRWIAAHREQLPAKVAIGIGGAFDFVAGVAVRAPIWMQRLGLEWLHRLIQQPWRVRRMLKLPIYALRVVGQAARTRSNSSA